jgi:hypothetical protein
MRTRFVALRTLPSNTYRTPSSRLFIGWYLTPRLSKNERKTVLNGFFTAMAVALENEGAQSV